MCPDPVSPHRVGGRSQSQVSPPQIPTSCLLPPVLTFFSHCAWAGADRFYDNIEDMIGYRPWPLVKISWLFLTPGLCLVCAHQELPSCLQKTWGQGTGCLSSGAPFLPIQLPGEGGPFRLLGWFPWPSFWGLSPSPASFRFQAQHLHPLPNFPVHGLFPSAWSGLLHLSSPPQSSSCLSPRGSDALVPGL